MLRRIRIASATGSSIDCKVTDADTGEAIGKRGPYIAAVVAQLFPQLEVRLRAGEPCTATVDVYDKEDDKIPLDALVTAFDLTIQVHVADDDAMGTRAA